MVAQVTIPGEALNAFCQRYPIARLALFGSVLREDFRPDSDIDVLVEFTPGAHVGYLDMAVMEIELSRILGRTVDLRTPAELSRHFRENVISTAQVLYERK